MYRVDTDHAPRRVADSDEVLSPSAGEQRILREEIMELSRESEREMCCGALPGLSAFGTNQEERQGVPAYAAQGRDDTINFSLPVHKRAGPGGVGHHLDQERTQEKKNTEIRGSNRVKFESPLCRSSGQTLPPREDISTTDIRRVDLIGRSITSMSLANAVEATMVEPTTTTNTRISEAPPLWSLVIRRCQLSSLIPVAGLLHHLEGLMGLRVHEVAGLALAGVERVLAAARCLTTLTICDCGLSILPRLQSGSLEVLDLSDNNLESSSGLEMLFRLKELNLAGNNISTLTGLRPLISLGAGCLRELSLDRNPIKIFPRYRESVATLLPSIRLLDGVAVSRPWRAGKIADGTTDRPVDGYLSDGAASVPRRAGRGNMRCNWKSRTDREEADVGEEHGFVRGLAGLGMIWGGTPPPRSSRSLCSSPVRTRAPQSRCDSTALFGSTFDGGFSEMERSGGIGSTKRCRPPSPARCRQMEADNARSKPRPSHKRKPRVQWDTSFRHHHLQETVARDFAKKRTARLSRHTQRATMDRLAQPVRRCNETGSESEASLAGDADLQAWNALFTEAILIESPRLVDRPTALKLPDGQWRGVVSTTTAGERKAIPTVNRSLPVSAPAVESQGRGVDEVNDVSSTAVPPNRRDPEPAVRGTLPGPTEETPPTSLENPTTSVSRLQEDETSQPPPSQPMTPPPPRATLVLPDEMALDDQAGFSRAAGSHDAGHTSPKTPETPLNDGKKETRCVCGQSVGTRSAISSPRSEGGCRDGTTPGQEKQPESKPGPGTTQSSPSVVRTRTPRVLKTSRDFAHAIRRVYKVDLGKEEAKALFHELDLDRDGALGAEDLLRGAPTVASFLLRTPMTKPDGLIRQGRQSTGCAGRAWNRSATLESAYRKRPGIRRGDARSSTRRLEHYQYQHQREAPIENDSMPMPTISTFSGREGFGFQPPTRSTFGGGIPRRLEDWRIPDGKSPTRDLGHGGILSQRLAEEQRLGQTWS